MKYLLDASSIYRMVEANRLEFIESSATISLARYELGNAVLKDCAIHKRIDAQKAQQLVGFLYELLDALSTVAVQDGEEVMKTAVSLKLSFYDAAYVQYSKAASLTLVTEDEKLRRKVDGYIEATDLDGILGRP